MSVCIRRSGSRGGGSRLRSDSFQKNCGPLLWGVRGLHMWTYSYSILVFRGSQMYCSSCGLVRESTGTLRSLKHLFFLPLSWTPRPPETWVWGNPGSYDDWFLHRGPFARQTRLWIFFHWDRVRTSNCSSHGALLSIKTGMECRDGDAGGRSDRNREREG